MPSRIASGLLVAGLAVLGVACEDDDTTTDNDIEDVTPETNEGPAQDTEGLDTEDITPELDDTTSTT